MQKHWPWLALAVVVAAGAGLVVTHDRTVAEAATAAAVVKVGTVGTPVTRDGLMEYTVTGLDCGAVKVSGAVPKGHFCAVGIVVRNLGGAARKPGISFAQAYDAQGAGYLADAVAQIRADPTGPSLLDDLAPGARLADRLFYDVPPARTITTLLLRESTSSAGIRFVLA